MARLLQVYLEVEVLCNPEPGCAANCVKSKMQAHSLATARQGDTGTDHCCQQSRLFNFFW